MWRLIATLQGGGYEVVFGSGAQDGDARDALEGAGIHTIETPVNDAAFDERVRVLDPAVVIFDRFMTEEQFSWRVRGAVPGALRVLDTIDLHFLRKAREANPVEPDLGPGNETLLRELAAMYRSDVSLIISVDEMALLRERFSFPENKLCYHPLVYPMVEPAPDFGMRQHFCTVGNYMHAPNIDAVEVLAKQLWPELRTSLPQAEMHVYGAYPSPRALQLNRAKEGFFVHGPVDDLRGMLHAHRVLLAPLRFGAGLKGKVMDAWYYGMPVVSSPIGAEGLFPSLLWGGEVAEIGEGFVEAACRLYEQEDAWQRGVDRGREILATQFAEDVHGESLLSCLEETSAGADVIGAMLWREQLRSTEFMSRWIEAKNT